MMLVVGADEGGGGGGGGGGGYWYSPLSSAPLGIFFLRFKDGKHS